jgi:hypothetical protein
MQAKQSIRTNNIKLEGRESDFENRCRILEKAARTDKKTRREIKKGITR